MLIIYFLCLDTRRHPYSQYMPEIVRLDEFWQSNSRMPRILIVRAVLWIELKTLESILSSSALTQPGNSARRHIGVKILRRCQKATYILENTRVHRVRISRGLHLNSVLGAGGEREQRGGKTPDANSGGRSIEAAGLAGERERLSPARLLRVSAGLTTDVSPALRANARAREGTRSLGLVLLRTHQLTNVSVCTSRRLGVAAAFSISNRRRPPVFSRVQLFFFWGAGFERQTSRIALLRCIYRDSAWSFIIDNSR